MCLSLHACADCVHRAVNEFFPASHTAVERKGLSPQLYSDLRGTIFFAILYLCPFTCFFLCLYFLPVCLSAASFIGALLSTSPGADGEHVHALQSHTRPKIPRGVVDGRTHSLSGGEEEEADPQRFQLRSDVVLTFCFQPCFATSVLSLFLRVLMNIRMPSLASVSFLLFLFFFFCFFLFFSSFFPAWCISSLESERKHSRCEGLCLDEGRGHPPTGRQNALILPRRGHQV